tara:strand:- start:781 stop:1107 length:327 start_codon:yes stop_codon:yes gene_type:complete
MKIQIIDCRTSRHEIWEELKCKYSKSLSIEYDSNLSSISIDLLNCNILLLHVNNHKEVDYYLSNKDNLNFNVIFFGGGIHKKELNDGNWYFPVDEIEKILQNIKDYNL